MVGGWETDAMKLILAEDDAEAARYLVKALVSEGHTVDHLTDGRETLSQAMSDTYDLIILDRMIHGLDGLSVLKALRAAKVTVPIILLTAMGSVEDRVDGLRSGADDYIVKPFAFVELMARIDTLRRRPALQAEVLQLTVADLVLDVVSRRVRRSGQEIDLQPREYLLLKHFMERPGRVQTRTVLLESVWGLHFDPKTSVVETHVSRLRNKMDRPFSKAYLITLHGVGYVFQP